MSRQFSRDTEENLPTEGEKGSSRQPLLLVLLVLVAIFGYLYFFTGLIKPREEAAKEPAVQTGQVKRPMPPRKDEQAENKVSSAMPEEKKQAVAAEVNRPAGGPVPPKAAPIQQPKPAPAPAKAEPAKTAKAVPAKVAKAEPVKTAKAEAPVAKKAAAKPALSSKPKAEAKTGNKKGAVALSPAKKPAPVAVAAKKAAKVAGNKVAGAYTLRIGEYVVEDKLRAVEAKLRKAAISPVERQKIRKAEPMHRLLYGEFADHESAVVDLRKLQKIAPDAFLLKEKDKFAVYAGSYYSEGKAAIEQDRLFDKGVKLVLKKAEVGVPVTLLTAGSFSGKEEAQKAAARLKKAGISATVTNAGKKKG